MFVRAYLRASTDDQDATRAREALQTFAAEHGTRIAATYVENASGTLLDRRELLRLLADAEPGDVLLVEAVDRLSRLDRATWDQLRERIAQAGLQVVSLDLPLTHLLLRLGTGEGDSAREWMTRAVSRMFLEFMAAFARKDYETRRARAAQGIAKAKAAGAYKGRPRDEQLHSRIRECLARGCRYGARPGCWSARPAPSIDAGRARLNPERGSGRTVFRSNEPAAPQLGGRFRHLHLAGRP